MSNLLEIDSVIKSFKLNPVLTDIYLKCETGDILGILGRNGAGKSTLLKILFGTMSTESKFIRIDGGLINKPYKFKNMISFLPQFGFLPKNFTVEKVAMLYIGFSDLLTFLNDDHLTHLGKRKISSLSDGEQRYLEIKLVLAIKSKFVLLDEPFQSCSPILIERIKELIISASHKKGVILADNDYRNVFDVANRYCLIFDGGIKKIEDKSELNDWGYLPTSAM